MSTPAYSTYIKPLREAALALVRQGWTQKTYARDDKGDPVHYQRREAQCFCLSGAVRRAVKRLDDDVPVDDVMEFFMRRWCHANNVAPDEHEIETSLVLFNDAPQRTQQEVIASLNKVVARRRKKGNSDGT